LQCPGCDTDYTSKRTRMTPEGVVAEVMRIHQGPRLVVITGGEPFRQNIGLLTQLLEDAGYQIQIETNGVLPVPDGLAASTVIVCSPKTFRVHPSVVDRAWAWKYVLDHRHVDPDDGLPTFALYNETQGRVARPPSDFFTVPGLIGAVYVQPMDEGTGYAIGAHNHQNQKAALATCLKYGYTFQLQLHKTVGLL
jgi:organic radical activating enzyme